MKCIRCKTQEISGNKTLCAACIALVRRVTPRWDEHQAMLKIGFYAGDQFAPEDMQAADERVGANHGVNETCILLDWDEAFTVLRRTQKEWEEFHPQDHDWQVSGWQMIAEGLDPHNLVPLTPEELATQGENWPKLPPNPTLADYCAEVTIQYFNALEMMKYDCLIERMKAAGATDFAEMDTKARQTHDALYVPLKAALAAWTDVVMAQNPPPQGKAYRADRRLLYKAAYEVHYLGGTTINPLEEVVDLDPKILEYAMRKGLIPEMRRIKLAGNEKRTVTKMSLPSNMAAVFGADPETGRIRIPRSAMDAEPILYSGHEFRSKKQTLSVITADFQSRGIHQHLVKILSGEMTGEHFIMFDEAYKKMAITPADVVRASALISTIPSFPQISPAFAHLCDKTFSPVRAIFHDDDPAKDRTLALVIHEQAQAAAERGDGATIKIRTDWEDGYKLLAAAIRIGANPWTDSETGEARVSGYEMIKAGFMTEDFKVTVTLTEEERLAGNLSDPPTEDEARNAVMSLYLANLQIFVKDHPNLAPLYAEFCKYWTQPTDEEIAEFEAAEQIRLEAEEAEAGKE
jgi:hypothetical protein